MTTPQPVHTSDLLALTRTIYGEARGRPAGQDRRRLGGAQPRQGGPAAPGRDRQEPSAVRRRLARGGLHGADAVQLPEPERAEPQAILVKTLPDALDDGWFLDCLSAALDIILGFEAGPTCGSTHYHTAAVAPAWPRGKQPVRQIGSHRFFNDVDREGSRPHRQAARRVCARCP